MRKSYLIIALVCFAVAAFIGISYGAEYSAVTKDDEVESVDAVQVKETKSVDTTYTPGQLKSIIASIQARITRDQAFLAKYQALLAQVNPVAEAVKLKAVVEEIEK